MCLAAFSVECVECGMNVTHTHTHSVVCSSCRVSMLLWKPLVELHVPRRHIYWNQIFTMKEMQRRKTEAVMSLVGYWCCSTHTIRMYQNAQAHDRGPKVWTWNRLVDFQPTHMVTSHIAHWWWFRLRRFVAERSFCPARHRLLSYRICARRHGECRKSNVAMHVLVCHARCASVKLKIFGPISITMSFNHIVKFRTAKVTLVTHHVQTGTWVLIKLKWKDIFFLSTYISFADRTVCANCECEQNAPTGFRRITSNEMRKILWRALRLTYSTVSCADRKRA